MKDGLLESLVFLSLMASGQAILPRVHGKEKFSGRNHLPEVSSPGSQSLSASTSSSTYECLYISSDLPPCDFERMEDSEEDIMHSGMDYQETKGSTEDFGKDNPFRSRRNVDDSARRHVIVYTIQGCVPSSLPFEMPSCQETNSLDKIVDVRRLYPFMVKGLTKAPLIFPEFNYDRWLRMMRRLRNRVASGTHSDSHRDVDPARPSGKNESPHLRSDEFTKTNTANEIMPKTMISSTSTSMGSSPNKFILPNKERPAEGTNTNPERVKNVSLWKNVKAEGNESDGPASSSEIEKTSDEVVRSSFRASEGTKTYKKNEDTLGKKAESYKKNLYAYQGSKVPGKDDERRKGISSDDRKIVLPLKDSKDATSREMSEIPIAPSLFRSSRMSMEDPPSDLRPPGNSLSPPKMIHKTEGNNEFTYSKTSTFSKNGIADGIDLPTSLDVIAENLRRRREDLRNEEVTN